VQVHWAGLAEIRDTTRIRVESRLHDLAAGHGDLVDVHIGARGTSQAGHLVKMTCQARGGHAITVTQERDRLGNALRDVLRGFEREVHRLRVRRRSLRRAAQLPRPDLAPPDLEA